MMSQEYTQQVEKRRTELETELKRIKQKLIEIGAKKIVVFGSYVHGNIHPYSDLDILAIIPSKLPFVKRMLHINRQILSIANIIVYTPKEFETKRHNWFIQEILKEGLTIHDST